LYQDVKQSQTLKLTIMTFRKRTISKASTQTYYKRVVTEKTARTFGESIANTKSPGKYKGMTKEEFTEATKYNSCFTSEVIAF
jgi:hypothetical protein